MKVRLLSFALFVLSVAACLRSPASPDGRRTIFASPNLQTNNFGVTSWANGRAITVDPTSATSCSGGGSISDNNNGAAACTAPGVGPVLHYFAFANRWGGYHPIFRNNGTITYASSGTYDDPVMLDPILYPTQPLTGGAGVGPTISLIGTLTTSSTANITAFTAKNAPGNGIMQVTVAGRAQELLFQNTTRANSLAWNERTTITTQPCAPVTLPTNGLATPACTENNAWANGDTLNLLSMTTVPIVESVPSLGMLSDQGAVTLSHLGVPELGSEAVRPGDDPFVVGDNVNLVEMYTERMVRMIGNRVGYLGQIFTNIQILGGISGGGIAPIPPVNITTSQFEISAGMVSAINSTGTGFVSLNNVYLQSDVVFRYTSGKTYLSGVNYGSAVAVDSSTTLDLTRGATFDLSQNTAPGTFGLIYGPGTLDADQGSVVYSATQTAPNTLPINLAIEGLTTVCCATAANPSVLNCSITLSTTALNAGACSSVTPALGNRAFLPGAGSFIGL